MAMLGPAAVAMWWDIAAPVREEFLDWHSHEHFVERLAIPGFRRGSRWADAGSGTGFFVLYELAAYETLTSPQYRSRLDAPTPWSTRLMPAHRGMTRSQCRVIASYGGAVGNALLTLRFSSEPGREAALENELRACLSTLPVRRGLVGAHLLRTDTPASSLTEEQRIRGGDAVADWIVIVQGYAVAALEEVVGGECADERLIAAGALPDVRRGIYSLSLAMTPSDLGDLALEMLS